MDSKGTIAALDLAKKVAPGKAEYWLARDIQAVLGYKRWENFEDAIQRAKRACEKSGENPSDHFRQTANMVRIGSGTQRAITDYFMDRYACYLVAMNGDPSISQIAAAQRYFAIQTRKQELQEDGALLDKRIDQRKRLTTAVVKLNVAARTAGVQNFALFHDAGYRGLYEMGLGEIKKKKGLSDNEDLYDRAGRAELAANEFHKTQTEEKIARDRIQGQLPAQRTYKQVGQEVRTAIRKIGGTMPEDMKPEESLKKLERDRKKLPKPRA